MLHFPQDLSRFTGPSPPIPVFTPSIARADLVCRLLLEKKNPHPEDWGDSGVPLLLGGKFRLYLSQYTRRCRGGTGAPAFRLRNEQLRVAGVHEANWPEAQCR